MKNCLIDDDKRHLIPSFVKIDTSISKMLIFLSNFQDIIALFLLRSHAPNASQLLSQNHSETLLKRPEACGNGQEGLKA